MGSKDGLNIISGVPNVSLPMDEILNRTVPGTFAGVVAGTGYVITTSGIKGQSLSFPRDAYLSYGMGNINTCFHLPDRCPYGVTFSMWLWLYENMTGKANIIFSSDENAFADIGYRIKYIAFNNAVQVKLGTQLIHQRDKIYINTSRWVHIAFTWHRDDILRVYANGCIAGHAFASGSTVRFQNKEIRIGGKGSKTVTAKMKIDDLLVWYKQLTPDQMWFIYEHGL